MAATNLPNAVLATTVEPWPVSIVRVRIDNLIRYVQIHLDLLSPERNIIKGDDPQILKMSFAPGVKCFFMDKESLALQPCSIQLGGLENIDPHLLPVKSHPVTHDYESFTLLKNLRKQRDMLCVVEHPALAHRGKMWRKVTEMPGHFFAGGLRCSIEHKGARDAIMHRYISELGLGIAPEFYGHVTEEGRGVIGFIYEYVEGAQNLRDLQQAGYQLTEADLRAVSDVVQKLHDNGFNHGNLLPHNIFRRPDGSMYLVDFVNTYRTGEEPMEDTAAHLRKMDLVALRGLQNGA